ncbi:2OG-Fe(II) oxygenase [Xanthomonas campestris pv. raphani]|uniref:2OG-Fe(II) oxygenase n=1 Tax=Xanthomonas campestris TaxID=339 RepID=UPI002B230641|nr:2OG-Fe(II) oxygenase [Xanthomonas campestris]MEA9906185.1 2OG-Fe(II) oxygenase [Xanthomonas campestris pv. raphani]
MDSHALSQLTHAAQNQAPDAMAALAHALVRTGRVEEAFSWYCRAAAAGDATARVETGRMLAYGIGCESDLRQALVYWQQAEQQGAPAALYLLASAALAETPLTLDAQAQARLLASATAGYAPALRAVAIQHGRVDHPAQQRQCVALLERAAAAGDVPAAALLAQRLLHGEGVPAQPAAAADLLLQLQAQGIAPLPELHVAPPLPVHTDDHAMHFEPPATRLHHHAAPRIEELHGVLSADECRLLMLLARPHLRPSQVVDPNDASTRRTPVRTSQGATLDPILEDFAARAAQARLAACAGLPLSHAEPLSVLCYVPGEHYRPHRDYLPPNTIAIDRPAAGNRLRTVCVYLNAVQAGGATDFPIAGVRVQPRAGAVVCFDNLLADGTPDPDSLHAGLPVDAGSKWLGTLWFRQRRYRDW